MRFLLFFISRNNVLFFYLRKKILKLSCYPVQSVCEPTLVTYKYSIYTAIHPKLHASLILVFQRCIATFFIGNVTIR